MNPVKFFLKTILYLLLICSVFIFINVIGNAIQLLFTNDEVLDQKTLVVIGDSHTQCAINDSLLPRSINLSDGGDLLFYSYLKFKFVLNKSDDIDTVVLSFTPNSFDSGGFYEVPKGMYKYLKYSHLFEFEDFLFQLKENDIALFKGVVSSYRKLFNVKYFIKRQKISVHELGAYKRLPETSLPENISKKTSKENELEQINLSDGKKAQDVNLIYLQKIITLCNKRNIKLILINTPVSESYRNERKVYYALYEKFILTLDKSISVVDLQNTAAQYSCYDGNHLKGSSADMLTLYLSKLFNRK